MATLDHLENSDSSIEAANARFEFYGGAVERIPDGPYCYQPLEAGHVTDDGTFVYPVKPCPYWAVDPSREKQSNGYCAYLKCGDWEEGGTFHLFDQVKECGVRDSFEFDGIDEELEG